LEKLIIDKLNENEIILETYETAKEFGRQSKKLTFFERLCTSIRPGSIRAGIFTMSLISLGSGCFALPKSFAHISVLVGIIGVILAGLAANLTLILLSISASKHKVYEYSQLIKMIVGRFWGNLLDISILVYIFGKVTFQNVLSKK
jgi:hypothetical protein